MSDFKIIDEQDDFIVVDKSENINFHDEGLIGKGLYNLVCKAVSVDKLYPVHRLDKMTSGLLIFAKNLPAAQAFQKLFEDHLVEKYYIAISQIKPKKKQGLIKGDMEKSRRGMYKLMRSMNNPAITQFFSYAIGGGNRLYLLKPHSGKTHQLRVALNSIGSPILGDPLYSAKTPDSDRGYLHAYALSFALKDKSYFYRIMPSQGAWFATKVTQKTLLNLGDPRMLAWPKL